MSFGGKSGGSQASKGHGSGQNNYFDMDDIIATQQRVPSRFEKQVYNLGYLEAGSDNQHIQPDTKMELPFWLAKALSKKGRGKAVTVDLPKVYKEGYREILSADASVVDLHKLGPYYYRFGTLLLQFEHIESTDIAASLLNTFQKRFRMIQDISQNAFNTDITKVTEKLDETERTAFRAGQTCLNDFMLWQSGETHKITTSDMVINHKKRKRAAMDS